MNYLRSLFLNFLVVFFVDRVIPGIEVMNYENVPNIGADILFSLVLGFLNASVFFFLALMEFQITDLKLGLCNFVITFGAFVTISLVPFGVQALTAAGVFFGSVVVWVVAFITNHLEWRHYQQMRK